MDYPELYYQAYPKVVDVVNRYLETRLEVGDVTQEEMDEMIDEVYIEIAKNYPEVHGDRDEKRLRTKRYKNQQRIFYGRGRILRDSISILLISELLVKNITFNSRQ